MRRQPAAILARRGETTAEQLAGHDDPLDLVGSLVDLHDFGVAHVALHRELARVADVPKDLHDVGGHFHRDICGEARRHGRLADIATRVHASSRSTT